MSGTDSSQSNFGKNKICPWRHAYLFDNIFRHLIHNPKKILGEFVKEGDTVADFGCGMGFFSLAMAKMIGSEGKVIAVDLQQEMLDVLLRRARRRGLEARIRTHRCESDRLGMTEPLDFALAFWMVHEVPDAGRFFKDVSSILKPEAALLVVEPKMHITPEKLSEIKKTAVSAGLRFYPSQKVRLSFPMLFRLK